MRLNHNKIVYFFILLFLFSGCKSLKIKSSDEFKIFQQIRNDRNLNNMYLIKEAEREGFKNFLIKESGDTMFDMWEWDSLQNFISYKDAKTIFNENEIRNYAEQLETSFEWTEHYTSKIINRNDLNQLKNEAYRNGINYFFVSLSKIVYTKDKQYALVYYSYTDVITTSNGQSGLLIYKVDEGKWKYFTELFLMIA